MMADHCGKTPGLTAVENNHEQDAIDPWDNHFNHHEQDAIDHEVQDINGFEIDFGDIEAQNGFDDLDAFFSASHAITEETIAQVEQFIEEIDRQRLIATNTVGRVQILYDMEALGIDEYNEATQAAKLAYVELSERGKEARNKMAELNDAIHNFFEKTTKNIENVIQQGVSNAVKEAKKITKDATAKVKNIQSEIDTFKIEEELLKKELANATTDSQRKSIQRLLDVNEKLDTQAHSDIINAKNAVKIATEDGKKAQAVYDGSTFKRSVNAFEKLLSKTLIDVKDTWKGMKQLSDRFHQAGEIMTKGYGVYWEKFSQGAEVRSIYWSHAMGFADDQAAKESKVYIKSLERLSSIKDREEFLSAAARYLTPSSRIMLTSQKEFTAILHDKEMSRFVRVLSLGGQAIKDAGRVPIIGTLKLAEAIVGPEIVSGLMTALDAVADVSISVIDFALGPEVQVAILFGKILNDLRKDGMSWKFADDFLGHFFLSLEDLSIYDKLQEYGPESSIVKDKKMNGQLKMMQYDSEELALVIDFWGARYIKLQGMQGHKYPSYKNLRPFKAVLKIPGRYINLTNHPNDTQLEIDDCQRIETMISLNSDTSSTFNSQSQINSWFPKKAGSVRNLRDFPVMDQTMQWPDPKIGYAVQHCGNFSKNDLDPTIVEAFVLWARNGTYGPVYNGSHVPSTQMAAINANKADLAEWLHPSISSPLAWHEIKTWVSTLRGKRGIMLSDMIELAPAGWLKEWDTDLEIKDDFFDFKLKQSGFIMTDVGYDKFRHTLGRYTYRPRDRKFLRLIKKLKLMTAVRYYEFPKIPYPPSALEVYPLAGIVNESGWYAYTRPATPDEVTKYSKILDDGIAWKVSLDRKSKESAAEWDASVLKKVWKDYIRTEGSLRTEWSYVSRHRQFFIEELMYVCNYMAGSQRGKAWANYMKLLSGSHIPLHMNSLHRATFMGMFASLAYSDSVAKDAKFISNIKKRFGGDMLENALVTTSKGWNKWEWAHHLTGIIVAPELDKFDIPITLGELNVRLFVLQKPRVLVIAIKGTTHFTDWLIDLDFSTGHFVSIDADRTKNTFEVKSVENNTSRTASDLVGSEELMTVHRGFLRAARRISPAVNKLMGEYFKKYDITDVFITGHSLGAAVTQLLCMMVPRTPVKLKHSPVVQYKNPNAYMFSSPAVGDERFERHFDRWSGESAQIWIDGDVIVTIPPFLLPDRDQSIYTYKEALVTLEQYTTDASLAGVMWAIHEGVTHMKLPSQIDPSNLLKDYKTFDKRKLSSLIAEIANAANQNRALRGGQVFMRLAGLTDYGFDESAYDSGNSVSAYHQIATNPDIKSFFRNAHKITNVVGLLSLVAKDHPDLFKIDAEDIPSWADGGNINPDGPTPGDKKVDHSIAEMLKNGTAHVVGYGTSKHYHKPWTVVPKEDIEQETGVWMGDETSIISGLEHANSVKRRKIDKSDHTYRGHDYI